MSIVESDWPPSWFLDASETGESTKGPWVGVAELLFPPVGLNDRHLRTHGKIGDCEQSRSFLHLDGALCPTLPPPMRTLKGIG